jgi:hypothetical protein
VTASDLSEKLQQIGNSKLATPAGPGAPAATPARGM